MAHTLPDYTTKYKLTTVFGQADNAELATRLGSIHTFNREGNVMFIDNFENGLGSWLIHKAGAVSEVITSLAQSRSPGQSVKCTTGAVVGNYAGIRHWMPYPVLGKFGFEISFTIPATLGLILFDIEVYDGTNRKQVAIRIDNDNSKYEYLKSNSIWDDFQTARDLSEQVGLFHTLKLVGDFVNDTYFRLIIDNETFDMTAYPLETVANATSPSMRVGIVAQVTGAAAKVMYVDDAIITQNEV